MLIYQNRTRSPFKTNLLKWYDENKRVLPWRHSDIASESEVHQRAYGVWVSEIMLQQTRVETVIDYYNKWMKKFPTVRDLAEASLEDVNTQWAGLGYYRRAKFLHQAAQKLVSKQPNKEDVVKLPSEVKDLEELPGVGKYTAGAISSIAFNKVAPLVDVKQDVEGGPRPGDFNQSLMELGALVCIPKNPKCKSCPVNEQCEAYRLKNQNKITSVEQFPVKKKKGASHEEVVASLIIKFEDKYLFVKRPDKGLLANMWEFPTIDITNEEEQTNKTITSKIKSDLLVDDRILQITQIPEDDLKSLKITNCGQITHVFTHINRLIHVYSTEIVSSTGVANDATKWMTHDQLSTSDVPTLVKKVFKQYQDHVAGGRKVQTTLKLKKRKVEEIEEEISADSDSD
ncbi:adenine DNA glycosylase [Acrasis kona]|uniref:Adenine DNA glycosylase n=1 Tax=Acrasis kona TaxID=1008807 RepID=A0AAW2ZB55_9EUKA